jgi:hypothetical protein
MENALQSHRRSAPGWSIVAAHLLGMALIALLNPHTLFVRGAAIYWLTAFALPVLIAACYAAIRSWLPAGATGQARNKVFIATGWQWLSVVLLFQWADV